MHTDINTTLTPTEGQNGWSLKTTKNRVDPIITGPHIHKIFFRAFLKSIIINFLYHRYTRRYIHTHQHCAFESKNTQHQLSLNILSIFLHHSVLEQHIQYKPQRQLRQDLILTPNSLSYRCQSSTHAPSYNMHDNDHNFGHSRLALRYFWSVLFCQSSTVRLPWGDDASQRSALRKSRLRQAKEVTDFSLFSPLKISMARRLKK